MTTKLNNNRISMKALVQLDRLCRWHSIHCISQKIHKCVQAGCFVLEVAEWVSQDEVTVPWIGSFRQQNIIHDA